MTQTQQNLKKNKNQTHNVLCVSVKVKRALAQHYADASDPRNADLPDPSATDRKTQIRIYFIKRLQVHKLNKEMKKNPINDQMKQELNKFYEKTNKRK